MRFLARTSVALFSLSLLTACGGDSDSSGDYYEPYGQSMCVPSVHHKTITVKRDSKPCRVMKPDLNNSRVFSLECTEVYDESIGTFDDFTVITYEQGTNIDSVINDIVADMFGEPSKYYYQCV